MTSSRVLLFANDLMPFAGMPTSGGGLRCFQLMRGLESHGIEVIPSMPGFTFLAQKYRDQMPREMRELLWDFETQDQILSRVRPDAVLYASNWDHYNLVSKPKIPLIIDLHGSRLIETAMWGAPESGERKVSVLSQADCLITAGKRQRLYFYGWLVQSGRIPDSEHFIRHVPISLSPDLPNLDPSNFDSERLASDYPLFVSGGGWFPWQNQAAALYSICDAVNSLGRGAIEVYGTPHQAKATSAEEQAIHGIYDNIKRLSSECRRIRVSDYISRDKLIQRYSKAHVAVELMRYNIERELAFTTRTIEYLWCGLPVIYNDYAEISEHISEYDAGWVVNPDIQEEIDEVIEEIYSSPDVVCRKARNAQSLVRERFTWDKTIIPLVDFLKNPKICHATEPVLGAVHSRPSFLNPQGRQIDVPISIGSISSGVVSSGVVSSGMRCKFFQRFVVPAENIAAVELSYRLLSNEARERISKIVCELWRVGDRSVFIRRSFDIKNLLDQGRLVVNWPMFRPPAGGDVLDFTVEIVSKDSNADEFEAVIELPALREIVFPLVSIDVDCSQGFSCEVDRLKGDYFSLTKFAKDSGSSALALSFSLAEFSDMYQIKMLARRAMMMLKRGEWKRALRAVRRRMPSFVVKVRAKLAMLIGGDRK